MKPVRHFKEAASITNLKTPIPGEGLKTEKMPGHWVLARMGKRVLRPGGMELTRRMLATLDIKPSDDVIEFAPGMGVTARLTLSLDPASYTAVERDEAAARIVSSYLKKERGRCVVGTASETGLRGSAAEGLADESCVPSLQQTHCSRHDDKHQELMKAERKEILIFLCS